MFGQQIHAVEFLTEVIFRFNSTRKWHSPFCPCRTTTEEKRSYEQAKEEVNTAIKQELGFTVSNIKEMLEVGWISLNNRSSSQFSYIGLPNTRQRNLLRSKVTMPGEFCAVFSSSERGIKPTRFERPTMTSTWVSSKYHSDS